MEHKEAKAIIESLLFISGEPLSFDTLKNILEIDKLQIEQMVKELVNDYTINNSGLLVVEVAGGVQMVTNPASSPWVKKLIATAVPTKLSQPSLETLAIIAYKQPIIKAEIEAIRGVNSDGVVKTLLERKLVKILGRKEVPGRPLMYGTTKEFLQYFGLKDLAELPTLKEFAEFETPEAPSELTGGADLPSSVSDEQAEGSSTEGSAITPDVQTTGEQFESSQETVSADSSESTSADTENMPEDRSEDKTE